MRYSLWLLLCLTMTAQAEEIYRWVDSDGKIYFSNLEAPANAVAMSVEVAKAPAPNTTVELSVPAREAALPIEPPQPIQAPPPVVRIYTTPRCSYCVTAKQYFTQHDIPYQEYDIQDNRVNFTAFKQAGGKGVPLILIGHSYRMTGFNPTVLQTMLQASGYSF